VTGKPVSDANALWAAYYAAQAQPYTYPAAAVQPVTGQQPATQYATISRAAVTPQPSTTSLVLQLESCNFHHTVVPYFYVFFWISFIQKFCQLPQPRTGATNKGGVKKTSYFLYVSVLRRDRFKVTIN